MDVLLERKMAGDLAPVGAVHAYRRIDAAFVARIRAAQVEMAARRRRQRRGQFAFDGLERRDLVGIEAQGRHAVEQGACVGMTRASKDVFGGADFDQTAQIHDRDAVGDVPHKPQIVADEQHRKAKLALQFQKQIDDLRLDRHVERGDGLVADQNVGAHRKSARDRHALALSAGKLVRIALGGRRIEPHRREPFGRVVGRILARDQAVGDRPFGDNVAHAHARIEGRKRILENHLHARRYLYRRASGAHDRSPRQQRLARTRRLDTGYDAPERRLAAAGLPDKAQHFALGNVERHRIDRVHGACCPFASGQTGKTVLQAWRRRKLLRDVLHGDQPCHGRSPNG
jgi:hypothetical protein